MIDLNLPTLHASTSVCYFFLFWMWFIFIIVSGPGSGSWWAIGWPAWDQRGKVVSVSFVPGGESGYRFVPHIRIDGRINHHFFRILVLRFCFFPRGLRVVRLGGLHTTGSSFTGGMPSLCFKVGYRTEIGTTIFVGSMRGDGPTNHERGTSEGIYIHQKLALFSVTRKKLYQGTNSPLYSSMSSKFCIVRRRCSPRKW